MKTPLVVRGGVELPDIEARLGVGIRGAFSGGGAATAAGLPHSRGREGERARGDFRGPGSMVVQVSAHGTGHHESS